MFRRVLMGSALTLSVMLVFCSLTAPLTAQSHRIPTTDGTNNWTGQNTFVPGNLRLGTSSQTCSGSLVMNGFTNTFTPICQAGSGVSSVNTLSGAITLAAGTNIGLTPSGNTITISSTATNGVTNVNSITGAVTIAAGANITVTPSGNTLVIAGTGGGVSSVNALTGAVVFAAGSNITLTPSGNTVTIASTGGAGGSGVTSLNSGTGALNITAGSGITVTPSGSNIAIAATGTAAGVSSVNSLTGAVVLAAGANVTLTPSGNTVTIAATGGGGGGALNTLVNDLLTNNAGNSAAQDNYDFFTSASYSNQSAVSAAAAHNGIATLLPVALGLPTGTGAFTNSSNVKVLDLANLAAMPRSLTEFGAQCNTRQVFVSVPLSSTTATISSDFFYPYDVGSTLVLVGSVGGVPTAYETVIVALIGGGGGRSAQAQLTTAAPVAFPGNQAILGHDDTANITSAMAALAAPPGTAGYGSMTTLQIPGSACLTHQIAYTGFNIYGINSQSSILVGFPGESIFAFPDSSTGSSGTGSGTHMHDFVVDVDNRIDATLPWQIINDSGTVAKAALYQPTGILTAAANNPAAPGWFQGSGPNFSGAINGVGAINSGTPTLMTVPAGVRLPTASQKIVFPYLSTVFTATVSSVNSGTRVVTLNASYPGTTASQIEWFAGTSPQSVGVAVSGGSCPASITLSNPVIPTPVTESNVAPVGLIQIDAEQFTYAGRSNASNPSTQLLTITGCAQNGTSRAAHSIGATIVPLNQFKPATPWPVTPTINAGATTPVLAAFYPAWNVGNGFLEAPVSNGATGVFGRGSFTNSEINNILVNMVPTSDPFNHTAGIYFVNLPYSTTFKDIAITAYYGIEEGTPAFNSGAGWSSAQPTADGSRWEGIRLNSCDVMDIIASNQNTYKDFNVYSQCESTLGTTVGANTLWYTTYGWNDETGGVLSAVDKSVFINMYGEPETGVQYGLYPIYEMDGFDNLWDDMHMGGGGENYIGGTNQHWRGGNFNNTTFFPTLDYGSGNSSDYATLISVGNPLSNVYGSTGMIEYGSNANWIASTGQSNGAFGPAATSMGGLREPIPAQTNEAFNTGNVSPTYVSSNGGFIPASEFNTSFSFESQAFNIPWFYDPAKLPDGTVAGGAVGCNLSGTPTNNCFSYRFNQNAIWVGPGQRLAAGKYKMYIASRSTGAATSYSLSLGACAPGNVGSYTVPVSSSYSIFSVDVDFTPDGTCGGGIGLGFGFSNAPDTLYVAFVDFAPIWQQPEIYNISVLNQVKLNGSAGIAGQVLTSGGPGSAAVWGAGGGGGGGGSVTSVGLVAPAWLTVTNSPITTAGNITIAATSQAQGLFLASPAATTGALSPRAIVPTDIPSGLPYIAGLSGDVSATGSGTVASTVNKIGGGTAFNTFSGLLQNTAGVFTQATTFNLTGSGQVGTRFQSGTTTVTYSATPNFDLSLGDTQILTLTGDVTSSTVTNAPGGVADQMTRFVICQDATGGRKFVWPIVLQGVTPVTLVANQCTSVFFNAINGLIMSDNFNTENCISSANPAVCDQATIGEVAVPTGVNPTLQINTTAWGTHSQMIFTPDATKGSDLSVTCNTNVPLNYQVTSAVASTSVTLTFYGTISTNPQCGTFSIRNP